MKRTLQNVWVNLEKYVLAYNKLKTGFDIEVGIVHIKMHLGILLKNKTHLPF